MFSDVIMLILEIVGTVSFAVSGAFVGIRARLDIFGVVFVSVITAFGGGILRDILMGSTPFVFKKHIYAIASICGSVLYFVMRSKLNGIIIPSVISMLLVFIIRMLATKYRWSLPKIKIEDAEGASK